MNKKAYHFELLSERNLQPYDKEILQTDKKNTYYLARVLKLFYSLPWQNPSLIIGTSNNEINVVVSFNEEGFLKIADYKNNLIMAKNEYYELFNFQELNTLNKFEIYTIANFLKDTNTDNLIFKYLIFSKELLQDLKKKNIYPYLSQTYDENGFNYHNYTWIGNDCDNVFFCRVDCYHKKYEKIVDEISAFTQNPQNEREHIKILIKDALYSYSEPDFGNFSFSLISDIFLEPKIKEELLSIKRYHNCHNNANIFARIYQSENKSNVFIVGGKIKENENDYLYHSWIEVEEENKWLVIDWNENLIIAKDTYYKLFEAYPIAKTSAQEMDEIIKITTKAGLSFPLMDLNYFGKEIKNDLLKRNILRKK